MSAFRCVLCTNAGAPTLAPRVRRLSICEDHHDALLASGRRWCEQGGHVAPASELRPQKNCCRACDNQRRRENAAANVERERAAARAWYAKHPDRAKARTRRWYDAHRDKVRAYHRAYKRRWRQANPGRERQRKLLWRQANRERVRQQQRISRVRCKLRILRGVM